ncbi:centromeric protein E [Fistulifera solaris]|uniref:Centromeric protein E n=1 Tax=Fistulifera solaris TaxID=1519565 RepID=A0A1Z5JZV7_FISSO|nr:centromeric protein E [Fistulifera solaris]|eukprot:GAX19565.1 centromeric protein E [Fistulifera solaris]
MNSTPVKEHYRNTPKKTPRVGPGSKATRENLPRKAKDTPVMARNQNDKAEEGIQVAIRMRPLNKKEAQSKPIWKVLPRFASVTQMTPDGQPLSERVTGRTFFTYDKAFPETATTRDVYNAMAKEIVESAITGVNGTVFAYGQTSSGKTFTMQGCGTIEEGLNGNGGGIVHMAAADIFQNIANQPNRVFLVRASFLEIYNEDVRDLLSSDNKTIPIREDPRRGVFVQCEEEIVSNFEDLLGVLFRGDKSRSFASTAMNERSSRSHTILRITIESREKTVDDASGEDSDGGGAVLVSTLNLVDLAGSESVRHTGATGERQKEGGMINQSLLTLSRVIVALGSSNQTHINFRDSKLTRILQPSLSGNSRISFICCATPTEMCLEETRSTLQFAARAKLVKTNARVNEVLDDRSIIKKLQRELEEARRQANGVGVEPEHLKALEKKAASAGSAAREAEEKLKRLQASILNSGSLLGEKKDERTVIVQKRRLSEGCVGLASNQTPQKALSQIPESNTAPRLNKKARAHLVLRVEPDTELGLYKQALLAKSSSLSKEKKDLAMALESVQQREAALADALAKLDVVTLERDELNEQLSGASERIVEFQQSISEKETLLQSGNDQIESLFNQLQTQLTDRRDLEQVVDVLQSEKLQLKKALQTAMDEKNQAADSYEHECSTLKTDLEKLTFAFEEKSELVETLMEKSAELSTCLSKEDHNRSIMTLELSKLKSMLVKAGKERDELRKQLEQTKEVNFDLDDRLNKQSCDHEQTKSALEHTTAELSDQRTKCASLESRVINFQKIVKEQEEKLTESSVTLTAMSRDLDCQKESNALLSVENSTLNDELRKVREENGVLKSDSLRLEHGLEEANLKIENLHGQASDAAQLKLKLDSLVGDLAQLETEKTDVEKELLLVSEKEAKLTAELSRLSEENGLLQSQIENGNVLLEESRNQTSSLTDKLTKLCEILEEKKKENEDHVKRKHELESLLDNSLQRVSAMEREQEDMISKSKAEIEELKSCVAMLETNTSLLVEEKERLNKQVVDFEEVKNELKNLGVECDEYKNQVSLLRNVISGHVATCQNSAKTIAGLQLELSETKQRTSELQHYAETAHKAKQEVDDLTIQLEESKALVTNLENQLHATDEEIARTKEELCTSQAESEQYRSVIATLEEEVSNRAKELESVRNIGADTLRSYSEESEDRIKSLTMQLSSIESNKKELETEFHAAKISLQVYTEEVSKLSTEINNLNEQMLQRDRVIDDLTLQVKSGDEAKQRVVILSEDLATLQDDLDRLKNLHAAAETRSTELDQAISAKDDELINLHEMLESSIDRETSFKQKLNDLEDELATKETILTQSLERHQLDRRELAEEIAKYQSTIDELRETLSQSKSSYEDGYLKEIEELKMLLTSSNTIADEAQEKMRQALAEVSHKNEEIIYLTNRAADLEERLEHAKSIYQSGVQPSKALEEALSKKDELQRDIELMQAKHSKFESDMISLMSEEKHRIVTEAEERMKEIEGELHTTQELLRQSEREAYLARQRCDEIHDQLHTASSSSAALLVQVGQLQSENESLKKSLQVEDEARNSEKKSLLAEVERRVFDLETEKQTLQRELERAEFTRQSEALNSKELRIKVSEMEILLRNATVKAEAVKDLEARLSTAEAEILSKEKELRSLSEEVLLLQQSGNGKEAAADVIADLNEQIKLKDERIKKLKKSTLTKEQVAAMKKLKEKSKTDQESLKAAQQKIAELEMSLRSTSSGDAESTELTRLRFHIEAIEKKLRKYASHCQQLEEERARLTHVLRGAKLSDIDPEDLSRSIVNLCDKVASLEEKYKMSESNHHETKIINQLQAQNASLESRLKESLSEISSVRAVEQRLKVELSVLQQEQEKLRKSLSESRHSADSLMSDSARKLRFLEKENLQLMSDLKTMRKDLQNANAKISMLELKHANIPTPAPSSLPSLLSYKLPPKAEVAAMDKENESTRTNIHAPSPAVSKPFSRLHNAPVDEENTQECAQS